MTCPCGRPRPYEACCGRYLDGGELPATAEDLMRSRYTAFAHGRVDYLMETQVSENRDGLEAWIREADFTELEILQVGEDTVEFVATWRGPDGVHRHHEHSSFERRDGRWIYVNGEVGRARPRAAAGRNDPCPCGSGRKFKKCCGAA